MESTDLAMETALINAVSERQAMDWSLVLASQDIASTLLRSEDGQWLLEVEAPDFERARESIRLYRLENRWWSWRRRLPWSGVLFHWGALFWGLALIGFHLIPLVRPFGIQKAGTMDSAAVMAGQWWRLFTAVTLHADGGHLAANVTVGFIFLGLAMARFGAGFALWAAMLAGALGNLLGLLIYPTPHAGLGASGMVMGALGLVAVHSVSLLRSNRRTLRFVLPGMMTGILLFLLLGTDPTSDVVAHAGGFLGGVFLGALLAWLPLKFVQKSGLNSFLLLGLAGFELLVWWLALHPH